MKKFYFLFLFALIASIGNLYAAEKTVTSTFKDKDLTVGVGEPGWVASITANSFESNNNNRGVQFGAAKGAFTLKTSESFSQVKKVSVILSTNEKVNTVSLKVGGTSVDGMKTLSKSNNYAVNWSVVSPQDGIIEFSFNDKKGSIYIKSISITYEEVAETKCAAPTFTPAAGFLKLGNAITFTSATADAEVYYQYSYNGGEYNSFVKGTSFTPDKEGTYKIIAKATKTGFEDGVSEEQIYEVGNLVFYESFDKNDGTGGNDGKWSGNIAADDIQYDVAGWTFINAKGANKCARIGTGSKGTATTPALTGLDGDAVLTFKAGAWNIEKENTTLNISITNGTLDKTSVVLKKGEFTEYTINITRADATSKIKFEAAEDKNNRFFLDEVKVVAIVKEPIIVKEPTATLGFTAAEINERPWLAANDIVLTEEVTEVKDASCVKLNCEEGAQIEYTLVSAETGSSTATVESGAEIVGLIKGEVYELTVCAVKGGYKSASRQYTFIITGSTSSVSSMSSEGVKVFAAEGGVEVVAAEATEVAVYTAAGQLVRQARVAEGSTLVNVAPGFYVVRANGTATKVIVR